eukprot:4606268-Amphidinium_carterae.1
MRRVATFHRCEARGGCAPEVSTDLPRGTLASFVNVVCPDQRPHLAVSCRRCEVNCVVTDALLGGVLLSA